MTAGLQPFLISEFKTGLFNYLEPWMRPRDAFEPLFNAFTYRGTIQKRNGYFVFGQMSYQDTLTAGNGGKIYSGILTTHPIIPGTFTPTDGIESFVDNSDGTLTGSSGGSGTINYTSGAWSLTFNANVSSETLIVAAYQPNFSLISTLRPIMGIKQWTNEFQGTYTLIVMDTRRLAVYNNSTNSFVPLNSVSQVIWIGDNSATTITISTGWVAVAPYTNSLSPYSISITDGISTITDDGAGNFSASGNFDTGSTINYATGTIVLNFVATTTSTITMTALLYGDYFSGNSSNFFNATNWQGQTYLVNNRDPITVYDGSTFPGTLSRPPFPITQSNQISFTNNIGTCVDLDVYKNRLLIQRPTLINAGDDNGVKGQSIRYSAILNPTNLVADVAGNGGEISAPTDDFIQCSEFLRDQLIVFFTNTVWLFRFTGSDFAPFRWDKINATKLTNAPYGSIEYDERVTAMGARGLMACDGVNVQRYDISIIDQFLDINQSAFGQCYAIRFDTTNQSWMLYPSISTLDNSPALSDSVLVYNFLENSWATYNIALSSLGLYFITSDKTWNDFAAGTSLGNEFPNWQTTSFAWSSYILQQLSPVLLGGGFYGEVYQMNSGVTDNGTNIEASITTTRWNPFIQFGQKVQFAYIDFYYSIDPDNPPAVLDLTFFTDNTTAPTTMRTLTLDGPINSSVAWKRVYINNIGEFLQMNIDSTSLANFKILGMILWAKPSGRLTP